MAAQLRGRKKEKSKPDKKSGQLLAMASFGKPRSETKAPRRIKPALSSAEAIKIAKSELEKVKREEKGSSESPSCDDTYALDVVGQRHPRDFRLENWHDNEQRREAEGPLSKCATFVRWEVNTFGVVTGRYTVRCPQGHRMEEERWSDLADTQKAVCGGCHRVIKKGDIIFTCQCYLSGKTCSFDPFRGSKLMSIFAPLGGVEPKSHKSHKRKRVASPARTEASASASPSAAQSRGRGKDKR